MTELPDVVELLKEAVAAGASDVHLCAGLPPSIRMKGAIHPFHDRVLTRQECREVILSILTEAQRARLERELELDFGMPTSVAGRLKRRSDSFRRPSPPWINSATAPRSPNSAS